MTMLKNPLAALWQTTMRIARRLWDVVCHSPTDIIEIYTCLAALGYGFWFLLYPDALTFPAWRHMGELMGPQGWGMLFTLSSLIELAAVGLQLRCRNVLTLVMAALWFTISVLIITTNAHDPPFVSAVARFLASSWVYLRRTLVRHVVSSD